MANFFAWIKKELREVIPAIIYFAIAFNIARFAEGLMLNANDIRYMTLLEANIFAIIMGKIVIIANLLPFINLFPKKPLIYNIIWKTIVYTLVALLIQLADIFIRHALHLNNFASAYQYVHQALITPRFWAMQILIAALFIYYVMFSEISRVLGEGKIKKLFFGSL